MNLKQTKLMNPEADLRIAIEHGMIEKVQEYTYLGHVMKLGKRNQTAEITKVLNGPWRGKC